METESCIESINNNEQAVFHLVPHASSASATLASLRKMQQNGQLCDVVLEADCGHQINAHRAILSGCSPYFGGMFLNNLVESTQRVVYIRQLDSDILEAVVAFAYNSEIRLLGDRVLPLLVAADLLQVHALFEECCNYLSTRLCPDNCLSLKAFAELHGCKSLLYLCTEFAMEHFEEIIQCEEFLRLPSDQLIDVISRDEVRVSCEEQVYKAVLQWVYHDIESRRDDFKDIISNVRLPFVSFDFLSEHVEREHLIQERECQDYVEEAYLYKSSPEKRSSLKHSLRARPRKPSGLQDIILCTGGMSKTHPLSSVEQYDLRTDSWTTIADMKIARYGLATCFYDGCLYASGGYNDTLGYLNSVECYSLREDKWKNVAPMKTQRRYHNAEVIYGLMYAAGGQSSEGVLDSVERYDPATDIWTTVQPMSSPRMYHSLAEMNGFLFSIGGHSGRSRLKTVEFYDPATNQWTAACSMSVARSVAGVASMGGSIHVAGGYNGKDYLDTVESYDIELNKWLPCPSMNVRRSALGLVAYGGCLYACGGFSGSFQSSVEKYVPGTELWENCVPMPLGNLVHFAISCT